MNDDFITMTIGKQKNIALIAHDGKKAEMVEWCEENKEILKCITLKMDFTELNLLKFMI